MHRDIKPANIMIVADSEEGDWPFVKLIDFGLARSVLLAHDSDGTTPTGSLGTAQSGSPEQIKEGNMDARSDILLSRLHALVSAHRRSAICRLADRRFSAAPS